MPWTWHPEAHHSTTRTRVWTPGEDVVIVDAGEKAAVGGDLQRRHGRLGSGGKASRMEVEAGSSANNAGRLRRTRDVVENCRRSLLVATGGPEVAGELRPKTSTKTRETMAMLIVEEGCCLDGVVLERWNGRGGRAEWSTDLGEWRWDGGRTRSEEGEKRSYFKRTHRIKSPAAPAFTR